MRNCVKVARQTLTLFVWVRILVPQPCKSSSKIMLLLFFRGVAQLVECCVRDAEAASSNLATPTKKPVPSLDGAGFFVGVSEGELLKSPEHLFSFARLCAISAAS